MEGQACHRQRQLTDVQKSDLASLWKTHSRYNNIGNSPASGNGDSTDMDDDTYQFIVRLHYFLITIICEEFESRSSCSKKRDRGSIDAGTSRSGEKETFASTRHLFFYPKKKGNGKVNPRPKTIIGRHCVTFDHSSFTTEFQDVEKQDYQSQQTDQSITTIDNRNSFGAFLYHRPSHGLIAINCALSLSLLTLYRLSCRSNSITQNRSNVDTLQAILQQNQTMQLRKSLASGGLEVVVRFTDAYPTIPISQVKTSTLHKFITVRGQIIKARPKHLKVLSSEYICHKCRLQFKHCFSANGAGQGMCGGGGSEILVPERCPGSGCRNRNKRKYGIVRGTAEYIDHQEVRVQEDAQACGIGGNQSNGESSAEGRTPRYIDVEISSDLVDSCHAGDDVRITGVVRAINSALSGGRRRNAATNETSTYSFYLDANAVVQSTRDGDKIGTCNSRDGRGGSRMTQDRYRHIAMIAHADHMFGPMSARMAFPFDLLTQSICPNIIGHDSVKAGILLSLLGGTPFIGNTGVTAGGVGVGSRGGIDIRSNIHMIVVGDPGMGKSQMLLAATQVAGRSVYVGGNTSSTTGLTVSLSKEKGGETGIEAGALVLADQGVCCIDEFDKMAKAQQDGLLEAMEQQQISIAKAGVVVSLPARCAIIAAANPKQGKYNMGKSVAENLNIAAPLLSRFDLVFILRDHPDQEQDKLVSTNIMNFYKKTATNTHHLEQRQQLRSFIENPSSNNRIAMKHRLPWVSSTQKPLPADVVKDYISYAREYCRPKLTSEAAAVLKEYFMSLRYPSDDTKRNENVPITTRQLEALIRLSQARAKACLREFVLREDACDVVELMKDSVNQVHMDSDGNIDRTRGGASGKSKRKQKKEFLNELRKMKENKFSWDDFLRIASALSLPLYDFKSMVDELRYCEVPEIRKDAMGMYLLND